MRGNKPWVAQALLAFTNNAADGAIPVPFRAAGKGTAP